MMKIGYFIIGIILIILGFITFTLIGIYNNYVWMNLNTHLKITAAGFILLIIGISSMILFYKQDEKTKKKNKVK